MRSRDLAGLAAVAALGLVGCAPKDAPVCQPVFSYATPAYGCGAAAAPVAIAVDTPPPPPAEIPLEPPTAPILAVLGTDSIKLAEKIQFKTGSPEILTASAPLLDQIAQILKDHPEVTKIRIEGYTDSVGSAGKNLALSQGRADAVRTHLQHAGVAAGRMVAKGFGEAKPIADNSTTGGRDSNRRVEITIVHRGP